MPLSCAAVSHLQTTAAQSDQPLMAPSRRPSAPCQHTERQCWPQTLASCKSQANPAGKARVRPCAAGADLPNRQHTYLFEPQLQRPQEHIGLRHCRWVLGAGSRLKECVTRQCQGPRRQLCFSCSGGSIAVASDKTATTDCHTKRPTYGGRPGAPGGSHSMFSSTHRHHSAGDT